MIHGRALGALGALGALLGALVAGCGPAVIWSGHTPDRRRRVDVIEDDSRQFVTIDGRRTTGYRAIAAWSMAFSADSRHLAYAARTNGHWPVIHRGRPGPAWDGIGEIVLSDSGRLAYAAERGGRWRVIVDSRAGPRFDAILAGTIRFSRDGRRIAYVGRDRRGVRAVVDGRAGPRFDGVGQLAISEDGARVAYAARRGDDAHVVVDGIIGPPWRAVFALTLSPTGGRVAYGAFDGRDWRVVVDGEPGAAVDAVHAVLFRADGRHVAWVATVDDLDVVVLDGVPVAAGAGIRPETVAFAPVDSEASDERPGLAHVAPTPGGGERVVIDGAPGPVYDEVDRPVWSADGHRLGYAARRGDVWFVVVDGRERPGGSRVTAPVFSPDGRRVAYLAHRGSAWVAVVDGRDHRYDLVLEDTLAFSRDSRSWSVIAGDLASERLFFVVDGTRRVPLALRELYSAAARMSPGGPASDPPANVLRAWSEAEADRAAAARMPPAP
jgi:WD40-like Beta Propeller Repeat